MVKKIHKVSSFERKYGQISALPSEKVSSKNKPLDGAVHPGFFQVLPV